jgi:hypothetical protein
MVHSIASTSKVKQNEPEDRPNHLRGKWREESQTLCNEDARQLSLYFITCVPNLNHPEPISKQKGRSQVCSP